MDDIKKDLKVRDKILEKSTGLVFYSLTPPKIITDESQVKVIANSQIERLQGVSVDGLLLYDIQDESSRSDKERTFAFIPTISPEYYSKHYLSSLNVPKIIYKSIGNLTQSQFTNWLSTNQDLEHVVIVGASSRKIGRAHV